MQTCPRCGRPIQSLNQWHNCVQVEIDSLFEGKKTALIPIFDRILAEVAGWEGVAASATQNCIVFVRSKTFLVIRPMKKELDLKFYLEEKCEDFPICKSAPWSGKWEHHIRIGEMEELDGTVFRFLRRSYGLF